MDAAQQRAHEQQVVAEMNTTGQFVPMTREGPPCNAEGSERGAWCDLVVGHRGAHFFSKPRNLYDRAAGLATNHTLEKETFGSGFAPEPGEPADVPPPEVHTEPTQEAAASSAHQDDPVSGGSANRVLVELGPVQLRCLLGLPEDAEISYERTRQFGMVVELDAAQALAWMNHLGRVAKGPVLVRALGSDE